MAKGEEKAHYCKRDVIGYDPVIPQQRSFQLCSESLINFRQVRSSRCFLCSDDRDRTQPFIFGVGGHAVREKKRASLSLCIYQFFDLIHEKGVLRNSTEEITARIFDGNAKSG